MSRALEGIERQLEQAVDRTGHRAVIIGQSRGGTLGRVLAARRPDLVERLVTLGSPVRDQLAVHPQGLLPIGVVGLLGTVGVPGLFRLSCIRGACCADAREQLAVPFPKDVEFVAVYSRSDEVVRWEACLDPAATAVEVKASHLGMGWSATVWRELRGHLYAPTREGYRPQARPVTGLRWHGELVR